ncbi:MAG: ABC exporter membrane fusion protein [Cyanobacteria bacterium P01_C01_bin.72]
MNSLKLTQPFIRKTTALVVFNLFLICNAIWLQRYILRNTATINKTTASEQTIFEVNKVIPSKINRVAALGTIEPEGEVIRVAPPPSFEGSLLKQLLVEVGERVTAGQTIAILDNRDRLQAALDRAKAQVNTAQARLEQVKAGASKGEIAAQKARIGNIAAELKGQMLTQMASITRLEWQLRGETQANNVGIARLKAELNNAQIECERFYSLFESGAVSDSEKERICLQADTAIKRLEEAKVNQQLNIDSISQQIKEAKASLKRTETTLAQEQSEARANLARISEVRPSELAIAQAEVAEALTTMEKARVDLATAYVQSPQNGQVLQINARAGERITEAGILEIGQTKQMIVRTEVYETDIALVDRGQPATITSSGFQGELKGTVEQIDLQIGKKDVLGTDPVAEVDSRVVEVQILLEPEASKKVAHLTNLQVYVVIDTESTTATSSMESR